MLWNLLARILAAPLVRRLIWRWAQTCDRKDIFDANGDPYMTRWMLFNNPDAMGCYPWPRVPLTLRLHWIHRADSDRCPHDHPWWFRTFILRGSYVERRGSSYRVMVEGQTSFMGLGDFHRITGVERRMGALTFVLTGRLRQEWGFEVDGRKVSARDYLASAHRCAQ